MQFFDDSKLTFVEAFMAAAWRVAVDEVSDLRAFLGTNSIMFIADQDGLIFKERLRILVGDHS